MADRLREAAKAVYERFGPTSIHTKLSPVEDGLIDALGAALEEPDRNPKSVVGWLGSGGNYTTQRRKCERRKIVASTLPNEVKRATEDRRKGDRKAQYDSAIRSVSVLNDALVKESNRLYIMHAMARDLDEALGWLVHRHASSCQREMSTKPWDQRKCNCGAEKAESRRAKFAALEKE